MRRLRFRVADESGFSTLYPECIDNNDTVRVEDMACGRYAVVCGCHPKFALSVAFFTLDLLQCTVACTECTLVPICEHWSSAWLKVEVRQGIRRAICEATSRITMLTCADPMAQYCMDVAFSQNNFVFQCRGL